MHGGDVYGGGDVSGGDVSYDHLTCPPAQDQTFRSAIGAAESSEVGLLLELLSQLVVQEGVVRVADLRGYAQEPSETCEEPRAQCGGWDPKNSRKRATAGVQPWP